MKILYTILLLLLTYSFSNSQARLGSSFKEINSEFSQYEKEFKKNGDISYLIVYMDDISSIYYFNEDQFCFKTIVMPGNEGLLHYFIEDYNSKFVVVSNSKWKFYTKGITVTCELIWDELEEVYYFLWSY